MSKKYHAANRLASTVGMSRDDWLRHRNLGIGSSDAAVAIGLSPYKSPLTLWLEKTARKTPDDLSERESIIWGQALEPLIAQVYAQRTGRKVRRVNALLQHPEHPFMLANLDREVICEDGVGVLEIKTAGFRSAPQWEDDNIPLSYQVQVLHQLAITGHAWAEVAVLIGGQDFRMYRIERDDDKIADLIEREQRFWHCVTHDIQPEPDGSDDAARALQFLYPRESVPSIDWSEIGEYNALFNDLLALRSRREFFELEEAKVKQRIQNALGEAGVGIFAGGKVTWKKSKDRLAPDVERLAVEHPKLVSQYTKPVLGTRRFVVQVAKPESGASQPTEAQHLEVNHFATLGGHAA